MNTLKDLDFSAKSRIYEYLDFESVQNLAGTDRKTHREVQALAQMTFEILERVAEAPKQPLPSELQQILPPHFDPQSFPSGELKRPIDPRVLRKLQEFFDRTINPYGASLSYFVCCQHIWKAEKQQLKKLKTHLSDANIRLHPGIEASLREKRDANPMTLKGLCTSIVETMPTSNPEAYFKNILFPALELATQFGYTELIENFLRNIGPRDLHFTPTVIHHFIKQSIHPGHKTTFEAWLHYYQSTIPTLDVEASLTHLEQARSKQFSGISAAILKPLMRYLSKAELIRAIQDVGIHVSMHKAERHANSVVMEYDPSLQYGPFLLNCTHIYLTGLMHIPFASLRTSALQPNFALICAEQILNVHRILLRSELSQKARTFSLFSDLTIRCLSPWIFFHSQQQQSIVKRRHLYVSVYAPILAANYFVGGWPMVAGAANAMALTYILRKIVVNL